jgi:hypothetical protein
MNQESGLSMVQLNRVVDVRARAVCGVRVWVTYMSLICVFFPVARMMAS